MRLMRVEVVCGKKVKTLCRSLEFGVMFVFYSNNPAGKEAYLTC